MVRCVAYRPGGIRRRVVSLSLLAAVSTVLVTGCGGSSSSSTARDLAYVPGQYLSFDTFQHRCEAPRIGSNPNTGEPYPDQPGSTLAENHFLRAWMNDRYLFYNQIPDLNPNDHDSPTQYFMAMRPDFDEFYFHMPTAQWQQQSQAGASVGYGIRWLIDFPQVFIAYVEPGSPGDIDRGWGRLQRGDEVLAINGVSLSGSVTSAQANMINRALSGEANTAFDFNFATSAGGNQTVTLTAETVTSSPVLVDTVLDVGDVQVGYILFNSHIAPAEAALFNAISDLQQAGVDELVLDLRYNGGGSLAIASQLAYMIAGPDATNNRAFESLQFNDKHTTINPFTDAPNRPISFIDETLGLGAMSSGQSLPSLDLPRVFVLSGASTCSASESIINALTGIDIDVLLFGAGTCGKPFGFYPTSNCGTTYFATHFRTVNDQGFGGYDDGFIPEDAHGIPGVPLPGCSAADDLSRPLGNPAEGRLAVALNYMQTDSCHDAQIDMLSHAEGVTGIGRMVQSEDAFAPAPRWLQERILFPDERL